MSSLMFWIYRLFLAPVSVFFIHLLGFVAGPKIKKMILSRQRDGWTYEKIPGKKLEQPFWVHAASGEIEYARPLLRELKKNYPTVPLVVTFTSPSAERILKNLTEVDAWGPSPWDLFWSCKKFVNRVNPRCVFFARTDVWPELITQLDARKIPSVLFSATFASNSSRLSGLTKFLTQYCFGKLTKIYVADKDDLQVLLEKKIPLDAEIGGDTRFDQVFFRLENPQPIKQNLRPTQGQKVFVAGSTWPEDEDVLVPWFAGHAHEMKLLLAPHELSESHLQNIVEKLKKYNIECDFYTRASSWEKPVLVLDQIGILAELYTWGNWAFVGGSFKKQVHSVMEPLAAGLPVWVGPHHQNNREALIFKKYQNPIPFVREVTSSRDLEEAWNQLKNSLSINLKNTIQSEVKSRRGTTQKLLNALASLPKMSH